MPFQRFFCCGKDRPIHLRDAFTGNLVSSYVARNHVDVVVAPFSIHNCQIDGRTLYAGYKKQIRLFDVEKSRSHCLMQCDTSAKGMGGLGQTGLISCFAQEPSSGSLIAVGCYDRSSNSPTF